MTSYATIYRKEHPEYYVQERIKDKERVKNLYHSNPEYKEKVKQQALARYYKLKEQERMYQSYPNSRPAQSIGGQGLKRHHSNRWIEHVKAYSHKHNIPYHLAIRRAKATYK